MTARSLATIALALAALATAACTKEPAEPRKDPANTQAATTPATDPGKPAQPEPPVTTVPPVTPATPADPAASAPAADVNAVAGANNATALGLFAGLRGEPGNLFFSPLSLSTALSLAEAGAAGDTAAEMAKALGHTLEAARLHPAVGGLLADLQARAAANGVELAVANRLWGQTGLAIEPAYATLSKTHYGAELATVDFEKAGEAARQAINAWVSDQTKGRIQDILAAAPPADTRLVLTNAVYFKGQWVLKFDPLATHEEPFKVAAGKEVKAQLMNLDKRLRYAEEPDLQIVELPYKGGELAMVVLLPREVDGVAALEARLTSENLARWLGALDDRQVQLALPRFKMTRTLLADAALRALGMAKVFAPDADLTGISSTKPLFIGSVLHKAFVEVNEEGTEAAAATALVVRGGGVQPAGPAIVRADHPFLFLIRDRATGAILFLGRLADPTA